MDSCTAGQGIANHLTADNLRSQHSWTGDRGHKPRLQWLTSSGIGRQYQKCSCSFQAPILLSWKGNTEVQYRSALRSLMARVPPWRRGTYYFFRPVGCQNSEGVEGTSPNAWSTLEGWWKKTLASAMCNLSHSISSGHYYTMAGWKNYFRPSTCHSGVDWTQLTRQSPSEV